MSMHKNISPSRDEVADPAVIAANAHAAEQADAQPATVSPPPVPQAAGSSRFHESARAQVQGAATYIDDMPEIKGTLHAAPILSTVAHGRLLGVETAAALALPLPPAAWPSPSPRSATACALSARRLPHLQSPLNDRHA